ncbi:MAG: hypothetical protein KKF80_04785, partial [Candidatus Omnitrophica bacterium]|nr:hypothetical protein [Candidatus Omnitrophota bacterium]
LVVPISKSGTTLETQLLAQTVRELFGERWPDHFLWLSDPAAQEKLNTLGWQRAFKVPIQFDGESDIGGRFSCPHTLIFFLPLFILLGRDYSKLQQLYQEYCRLLDSLGEEAAELVNQYKGNRNAFFSPYLDEAFGDSFSAWIVQLFQESLGSKRADLAVKTICVGPAAAEGFLPVKPQTAIKDPVVRLMAHMYFFQVFVALYAGARRLNFVNQEFVEKYKQAMRQLEGKKENPVEEKSLSAVITQIKKKIVSRQRCIEVVLFFYPQERVICAVRQRLSRAFPGRHILVFIGSDWNHHSYQAAFGDKNTYFVFLRRASYGGRVKLFKETRLEANVKALKTISQATYVTLKNKSFLCALAQA